MHYYCGTCDNRIEGKVEIQSPIECQQCGGFCTMAELVILDNVYLFKSNSIKNKSLVNIEKQSDE